MVGQRWDERELTILKENYESQTEENFIILLPDRSYKSLEHKANRRGLAKPSRAWSEG